MIFNDRWASLRSVVAPYRFVATELCDHILESNEKDIIAYAIDMTIIGEFLRSTVVAEAADW